MFKIKQDSLSILFVLVFVVAMIMIGVNMVKYRYPGLYYSEPNLFMFSVFLFLVRWGLKLQFSSIIQTDLWKVLREVNRFSFLVVLLLFAITAVQYTPFKPIDSKILLVEHYVHLDLKSVMLWLNQSKSLKLITFIAYYSLLYQVILFPFIVIFSKKYDVIYQFYFLVLVSWLIGGIVYYFFPTTGPASMIDSPYFIEEQRATGLKFWQLHHYIQPLNSAGGLIAMPSYHVIWGWLCASLLRPWPIAFWLIFSIYIVMVASCVLLGWHYFLDVIGSIIVLLLSYAIFNRCHQSSIKVS